jgi:hypothetical protein
MLLVLVHGEKASAVEGMVGAERFLLLSLTKANLPRHTRRPGFKLGLMVYLRAALSVGLGSQGHCDRSSIGYAQLKAGPTFQLGLLGRSMGRDLTEASSQQFMRSQRLGPGLF